MALQSEETEKGKSPVPQEAKVDTAKIITGKQEMTAEMLVPVRPVTYLEKSSGHSRCH